MDSEVALVQCVRRPDSALDAGLAPQTGGVSRTERLIAMQKVVGSNPISRFGKVLQSGGFLASEVGKGVCVGGQ
jgi:hypothetical protein